MSARPFLILLVSGLLLLSGSAQGEEEKPVVIEDGRKVSLEYTLKLEDGSTADTNVGGEPLVYQQGSGQILPALEQELRGLKTDDHKKVTLSAEQGYGVVNPEAVVKVPVDDIPDGAREVGARLVAEGPEGSQRLVRVREVHDTEIVLDLNHPLAGQKLHFDVRVLGVE